MARERITRRSGSSVARCDQGAASVGVARDDGSPGAAEVFGGVVWQRTACGFLPGAHVERDQGRIEECAEAGSELF